MHIYLIDMCSRSRLHPQLCIVGNMPRRYCLAPRTLSCCGACRYAISKTALVALTKALAEELGPDGIRVNCVAPGKLLFPLSTLLYHPSFLVHLPSSGRMIRVAVPGYCRHTSLHCCWTHLQAAWLPPKASGGLHTASMRGARALPCKSAQPVRCCRHCAHQVCGCPGGDARDGGREQGADLPEEVRDARGHGRLRGIPGI